MEKKYAKEQLQEVITRVNNIMPNDKVVCVPSDCPTFDEGTSNYVRERLKSWVLPKLDE